MKKQKVGLESLVGKKVLLLCSAYFYTGVLGDVTDSFVELKEPAIVYETGAWGSAGYTDAQKLHVDTFYVQRVAIESFGESK